MLSRSITRAKPVRILRQQPVRRLHQSRPLRAAPEGKEDHRAHTITQRLRSVKKIPPELIPLGIVLLVALGAAGYSSVHKLFSDKTLRLRRSGGQQ